MRTFSGHCCNSGTITGATRVRTGRRRAQRALRVSRQGWNGPCSFRPANSHHGATDGRTEAQLVRKEEHSQVREGRIEKGGEQDEQPKENGPQEERPEVFVPQLACSWRALDGRFILKRLRRPPPGDELD